MSNADLINCVLEHAFVGVCFQQLLPEMNPLRLC